MKKISILFLFIIATTVVLGQEVRDHRNNSKPATPPPTPSQPPPVAGNRPTGVVATTIIPGKWYYIRHAGTQKYMMIAGHKDQSRSFACLNVEEMQQDNTSQQWRFVAADENGGTVYKLQNRRYTGYLYATIINLYMEFRRITRPDACSFMMVMNPDKSWYILTRLSENSRALSTTIRNDRHCFPSESDPLIGGRVLQDYECANSVRNEFVTSQTYFTGKSDQKWILEEVKER